MTLANSMASWSEALIPFCKNPEKFPKDVIFCSDIIVAILDKYPKAKHHFLVMPRLLIDNIYSLNKENLPLLEQLSSVAKTLIETKYS